MRRAVACALRLVRPRGAGNDGRNRSFLRMELLTVGVMGIAFCALGEFFPAALPPLAGIVGVWVALPLAELVTAALAVALLHRTR